MTVFYPVQIKVTEPQIKSISLNLPTKYLRRYAKQYHFILVQIKVTESQIKFTSLNLPTKYLRRYAKQYHFILVQIKVTEPQMICLYKTNQRGGSGDTTLLNKSCKRKLPSRKLNLYLLTCQRGICGDTQSNIISYLCK